MKENKITTYLLYAIGEIVLVVVGILIAVSIDDWNEQRVLDETLQNQLETLREELKRNKELLKETIASSENVLRSSKELITLIGNKEAKESAKVSLLIGDAFSPVLAYQPNTAVLSEMITSGSLRRIKNIELKSLLLNFESELGGLHNQEKLHAEDQKSCADYMLTHGDFRRIMDDTGASEEFLKIQKAKTEKGNVGLISSKEFENRLLLFTASGVGLHDGRYLTFLDYLDQTLAIIDLEIKK